MSARIEKHKRVSIQYSLTTANGVPIRAAAGKAVHYVHGCGSLFPKLEAALEGHGVGEVLHVRLLPDDAFGRRNTELLHEAPLADIPAGEEIAPGRILVGQDEDGNAVNFRVTAIDDDMIKLDANHPLAGETLIFEVEIQSIQNATPAEIAEAEAAGLQTRPE
ncbi:MAG: FKBP-type peptidyl-prolyl cis-trans isomerase [Thiohalobacteraceae bacterium]